MCLEATAPSSSSTDELSASLEENLQGRVRRAAALEERDGRVQVDLGVEREDDRRLGVVAGHRFRGRYILPS